MQRMGFMTVRAQLTASFDGTARIWYLQNGDCRKMLVARPGGQALSYLAIHLREAS